MIEKAAVPEYSADLDAIPSKVTFCVLWVRNIPIQDFFFNCEICGFNTLLDPQNSSYPTQPHSIIAN